MIGPDAQVETTLNTFTIKESRNNEAKYSTLDVLLLTSVKCDVSGPTATYNVPIYGNNIIFDMILLEQLLGEWYLPCEDKIQQQI